MKLSKTLIAASVAALVAGAAVAGDGYDKSKAGATFDALDTNRDGRISKAEAAADSKIVFSTADANSDGYLDSKEYKMAVKASDSSMPSQPQSVPSDSTDPSMPQEQTTPPPDQSTAPPSDTETPRQ